MPNQCLDSSCLTNDKNDKYFILTKFFLGRDWSILSAISAVPIRVKIQYQQHQNCNGAGLVLYMMNMNFSEIIRSGASFFH